MKRRSACRCTICSALLATCVSEHFRWFETVLMGGKNTFFFMREASHTRDLGRYRGTVTLKVHNVRLNEHLPACVTGRVSSTTCSGGHLSPYMPPTRGVLRNRGAEKKDVRSTILYTQENVASNVNVLNISPRHRSVCCSQNAAGTFGPAAWNK